MLSFPEFAVLLAEELGALGTPAAHLTSDTHLIADLGLDSMNYLLVLLFVEELAQSLDIPDPDDLPMTVGALYDHLGACVAS